MPDSSRTILASLLDGSFRLACDGSTWSAVRTTGGFRVETDAGIEGWLEDRRGDDGGFVLHAGAGDGERELGRTSRPCGSGPGAAPTTVLLDDGRLFRIDVRGLSPSRVELSSDEAPGAYFVARPAARGFEIETTVAGRALEAGPALLLLFGAEIARLAADGGASSE